MSETAVAALFADLRDTDCALASRRAFVEAVEQMPRAAAPLLLRDLLEYAGDVPEESPAQQFALAVFATFVPRWAPALSIEELSFAAMFLNMLLEATPPTSEALPVAIDGVPALYTAAVARIASLPEAECAEADSLLTELEGLRTAARGLLTTARQHHSAPAHVVGALKSIVLGLVKPPVSDATAFMAKKDPSSAVPLPVDNGAGVEWCGLPEGGHGALPKETIDDAVHNSIEGILAPFTVDDAEEGLGIAAPLAALAAIDSLFRHRPATWPQIVPDVCSAAQRCAAAAAASANAATGGLGPAGLAHGAVLDSMRMVLSTVVRCPEAKSFHSVAAAAFDAVGSALGVSDSVDPFSVVPAESVPAPKAASDDEPLPPLLPVDVTVPLAVNGPFAVQDTAAAADAAPAEDEDAALSNLVQTSAGPMSHSAVVALVLASLKVMPRDDAAAMGHLHFDGLRAMQTLAARRAQKNELDKIRAQEARGVESIPVGRLLHNTPIAHIAVERGGNTARRPNFRTAFLRAAFSAALRSYQRLATQYKAAAGAPGSAALGATRVARAQALLAHVYTQLPPAAADMAADELTRAFDDELRGAARARAAAAVAAAAAVEGGDGKVRRDVVTPGDAIDAFNDGASTSLLLQVLFTTYAQLAPPPRAGGQFFSTQSILAGAPFGADGDVGEVDVNDPLRWLLHGNRKRVRGKPQVQLASLYGDDDVDADGDLDDFQFDEENTGDARLHTGYTHLLCRALHSTAAASTFSESAAPLLALLTQCPAMTLPVWLTLHRSVCLAKDGARVKIGIMTLGELARRRPNYAPRALGLLLSYSTHIRKEVRIYAVRELRSIAVTARAAAAADPNDVDSVKLTALIVNYAKAAVGRIPALGQTVKVEAGSSDAAQVKAKLKRHVERHLTLFIALCALELPLFGEIFAVFDRCGRPEAGPMGSTLQDVIEGCEDIRKLMFNVCTVDRSDFWQPLASILGRSPVSAVPLVYVVLESLSRRIVHLAHEDKKRSRATSKKAILMSFTKILVGTCASLASRNAAPGAIGDVRLHVAALPFTPTEQLKERLIPALLALFEPVAVPAGTTAEAHKRLESKQAAIAEEALWSLMRDNGLGDVDGKRCCIGPVELLVHLHSIYGTKAGGASNRAVNSAIAGVLRLKRPLEENPDATTPIIAAKEAVSTLRRLVTMDPIPTTTMRTALLLAKEQPQATAFVAQTALPLLVRRSTWQSDPDLWKGAALFVERAWPATREILVSLPRAVLLDTLQNHATLLQHVREERPTLPSAVVDALKEAEANPSTTGIVPN